MVRFLNVYYPTRAVLLFLFETILILFCFLLATSLMLGYDDALIALNVEYGWVKIVGVTALLLMSSYYFDLYDLQIVSTRQEVYFRVLLVLGFSCLIVSSAVYFYPPIGINPGFAKVSIFALGFALLTPSLLLWRWAYEWIAGHQLFRERVYVLGGGAYARSIVEAIQSRRDIGMEAVGWQEVQGEPGERKKFWIEKLSEFPDPKNAVSRIIVAIESQRGELPIENLLQLRFQGIKIEDAVNLRERLSGKIQLDALRASTFLYSEGFRLHPSH